MAPARAAGLARDRRSLRARGEGLAEAHAAGIIHRDFKPDNVLVGDDGKALRVTDFGLARAAASEGPASLGEADTRLAVESPGSLDSALTRTGTLVGTPVYMAPEQLARGVTDARADLFSFCVALYEALYGERPFAGGSLAALHAAKLANKVRSPPKGTRVPPRVRRVVLSGLEADPERRPRTVASLLSTLRRAARRPRLPWVAAASLVAGAAAASMYAAGTRQRPSGTGPVAAPTVEGVAPARSCSNAQCASEHGGAPWLCRAKDQQCMAIETERCKAHFEPGDLGAEDTIWLGALLPMTGPLAEIGKTNAAAVELGRHEFAQATRALTGPNASLRVRRVAVVTCDDGPADGLMETTQHLVEDIGVPAILGFRSGQELVDLAGALLVQRHVLSIATLSPSALVTQIPQPPELPRMVWRTGFGMGDVATATAAFVHDYFEPRRARSDGPTRVAVLRTGTPGAVAFARAFLKSLTFNGRSAVDNGERYQEIELAHEFAPAEGSADADVAARRVIEEAPSFVVTFLDPSQSVPTLRAVEDGWPRGKARPIYLLAGNSPDALGDLLGSNADLRHRVLGVLSSSGSAANAPFVIRFNEANLDHVSRTQNPGSSYDAFYLLAFGANAADAGRPDGVALSHAFGRFNALGRAIEVGPTDAFEALAELSSGKSIDLVGATSRLGLDPRSGEAAFDYVLVCVATEASGKARGESLESGVSYRASTRRVAGSLACP